MQPIIPAYTNYVIQYTKLYQASGIDTSSLGVYTNISYDPYISDTHITEPMLPIIPACTNYVNQYTKLYQTSGIDTRSLGIYTKPTQTWYKHT